MLFASPGWQDFYLNVNLLAFFYSLSSWEGHVQTNHPDNEEGDDSQGQQQ